MKNQVGKWSKFSKMTMAVKYSEVQL